MRVLGLIPARGGSKGVPRKNAKLLGGKPLVAYSIEAGLASNAFAKLVVSTDDDAIAQLSREHGAEVPFMRPEALAQDSSPTLDTVVHALQQLAHQGEEFDAVCLLQPTVPFRDAATIQEAVIKFAASGADSMVSIRAVPHQYNPHWTFAIDADTELLSVSTGESSIIPRRQELPDAWHRDGSIYITKSSVILEQHSLYGKSIAYVKSAGTPNINIDTPDDWQLAEAYLAQHGS